MLKTFFEKCCSLYAKNLAVSYWQNLDFTNETNPADIPPVNLKFDTNFKR